MDRRSSYYVLAHEAETILRSAIWNRDSVGHFARKQPSTEAEAAIARAEAELREAVGKVRRLFA